jgi:hypothetical protein
VSEGLIWETDFRINSRKESTSGFALWYIKRSPFLLTSPGSLFGMNEDFNGLGVFIFPNSNSQEFNVMGAFNRGMDLVKATEDKMTVHNSCKIHGGIVGRERYIKFVLEIDKVIISIGEKGSDATQPCFTIQTPDLRYHGYVGYSSGSFSPENTILNDIDITRVRVQNTLPEEYKDFKSTRMSILKMNWDREDAKAEDVIHGFAE